MIDVRVQEAPFDFGREAAAFQAAQSGAGAVVTFSGIVRGDDGLRSMEIEHYPGMTEKALREIAERAADRWNLTGVCVIHRYGLLHFGETIMMVAAGSRHRVAAFDAAQFLMDYLKSRAPFWKREVTNEGTRWVAAKDDDEAALGRWVSGE